MKKRFLSLALALAVCLGLVAPALAADGDFTIKDGVLTKYNGSGGDVTIPDGVTDIGQLAFQGCTGLTSVTFPEGVTGIGLAAFSGCTGLTSVTIPDGVDKINSSAFELCTGLTSVTIPSSVNIAAAIGNMAFYGCESLTDVYYGGSEAQWNDVMDIYYGTGLENATIHFNGVKPETPAPATPTTPTTPTPANPAASSFTDMKEGDYFAQPVLWAVEKGITNGTSANAFSPNQTCTVAQILTFLSRAKGSPEPAGTASLPGVDARAYYYKPAAWALEQGLTNNFSADAPCTRSMVVEYLWKLAGSPAAGTSKFTDVPAGAAYAQAVAWAVEQGITSGTSETTFSPDDTCTGGQIVTFLYRAFAISGRCTGPARLQRGGSQSAPKASQREPFACRLFFLHADGPAGLTG